MGYLHIYNLYKAQEVLLFKEVYALEKIHGTSAHIRWKDGAVGFFAGGENHEKFVSLFDQEKLKASFIEIGQESVVIYGEAYGGKQQGMSKTYGPVLKFIVFDVLIEKSWLSVPNAHELANKIGLEFVHYEKIPATLESLDSERDRLSTQAKRNGVEGDKIREGIVIRPLIELTLNNGSRLIAKHKRAEFSERKSIPEVDPTKREIREKAETIAEEWVTPMRLQHVLDKLPHAVGIEHTGEVIKAMVEDVCREASGEIVDSKDARRAIGHKAALLYKKKVTSMVTA